MKGIAGVVLILALGVSAVYAHPGRTASDGCHYCRTNCDRWGVPEGQRHCHYQADPRELGEEVLKVASQPDVTGEHSHVHESFDKEDKAHTHEAQESF